MQCKILLSEQIVGEKKKPIVPTLLLLLLLSRAFDQLVVEGF
jgi:hypothetical protein